MQVKAAVTLGYQQPFVIKDVEVAPPGKDEILVKIVATGVCHTDAVMRDNPGVVPMPAILGHEGAGIVASVGEAVSGIRVGDHVVLSYAANAAAAGLDGVVCSPLEAGAIHRRCGADFLTVTPGVRFAGGDAGDQKRVTTPAKARELGAQGIGLCRTEHMFFEGDRIAAIREMICSDTVEQREKALAKLLPMQQGDFEGIYEAMEGNPVTIRFLDPPLHEFVPTEEADIELLAKDMGKSVAEIKAIIASLHEFNPMMGHRGCRLAVTFPEIAVMQTRAVIRAAINVQKRHPDWNMVPEIMIPLVGEVKELKYVKSVVVKTADEELAAAGMKMKYLVGTMIEIPRAALTADDIAKEAEFFSFGTNDLTQMTFGFSRDDAGKFLGAYYDKKIYENDPFAKLDQVGVGKLVEMAAKLGRATRPDLHLGICGEHGGDPSSVEFCHRVGLDYVSCSPFRVPIARLAAAQAAIKEQRQ